MEPTPPSGHCRINADAIRHPNPLTLSRVKLSSQPITLPHCLCATACLPGGNLLGRRSNTPSPGLCQAFSQRRHAGPTARTWTQRPLGLACQGLRLVRYIWRWDSSQHGRRCGSSHPATRQLYIKGIHSTLSWFVDIGTLVLRRPSTNK